MGVVVGALVIAAPASAAEPLYASPSGSGTVCSSATPCQLTKAIELVGVGGSVVVKAGTYSPEGFFLNKAVDLGGLPGAAGSTVIEITTGGLSQVNSPGAVVHDLTFRTSGTAGGFTLISGTAERIFSNLVGSSGGGACVLDAQGAAPPVLRDSVCWAHGSLSSQRGGELLLSSGLTSSAVLRNDDFISATSAGLGLRVSASSAGTHFSVEAVNVIAEGAGKDVFVAGTIGGQATVTISHSNFSTLTTEGSATASAPTENGNQQGQPQFVAPLSGAFTEKPTSPTLEMGLTGPANGSLDLAGALRTRSTCAETFTDIGAYQLVSAPVPSCTPPSTGPDTGAPSNRVKLGKLRRNLNKGTAVLTVTVPGAGKLSLSGKAVRRVTKNARGAAHLNLRIVPRGRFKTNLGAKGTVRFSVTVTFTPTGGTAAKVPRKLTLLEKLP